MHGSKLCALRIEDNCFCQPTFVVPDLYHGMTGFCRDDVHIVSTMILLIKCAAQCTGRIKPSPGKASALQQRIENLPHGCIGITLHDAEVIAERTVGLHAVPDAVFDGFYLDAEVIPMLNERLPCRIERDVRRTPCQTCHFFHIPVNQAIHLIIYSVSFESQPAVGRTVPLYQRSCFGLNGKIPFRFHRFCFYGFYGGHISGPYRHRQNGNPANPSS